VDASTNTPVKSPGAALCVYRNFIKQMVISPAGMLFVVVCFFSQKFVLCVLGCFFDLRLDLVAVLG
jgi:hypothetical protein